MPQHIAWLMIACCLLVGLLGCAAEDVQPEPRPPLLRPAESSLPESLRLKLGKGVTMDLRLIPAGAFRMGSPASEQDRDDDEGPVRQITLTRAVYLGVHEVTQQQYEAVLGRNPSKHRGPKRPVDSVTWQDAVAFCRALSNRTGRAIRLPTEAEWERAARAGSTSRFCFGDAAADLHRFGNYYDREHPNYDDVLRPDGYRRTAPVGSYQPNAWGFCDMHGNVFEWCFDWYTPRYPAGQRTDPAGAPAGAYRVSRGGSWASPSWKCRSAYRNRFTGDGRYNDQFGFRVVVDPHAPKDQDPADPPHRTPASKPQKK